MKILFFAPYKELVDMIEHAFDEQNSGKEFVMEVVVATKLKVLEEMTEYPDVVVARGTTASACKERFKQIPVVELQVSAYDVLKVLSDAKKFNPSKVAVIGSRNMIQGIDSVKGFFDFEIVQFYAEQVQAIDKIIRKISSQGFDTVIGGGIPCEIASQHGLNSLVVESGREAIWSVLKEAMMIAKVRKEEQEESQRFTAVLEYAAEGIIAFNANDEVIVFNPAAEKITNLEAENVLLKNVTSLLNDFAFYYDNLKVNMRPILEKFIKINDVEVVFNCIPIIINNTFAGGVLTIQNVSRIQELESRIRFKSIKSGHIAKFTFKDIYGESKAVKRCIELAEHYSKVDSNILIQGETGTGKEIFAQSIHNASNRFNGPFVAINCAALPENLLESELFGYVEGAFTGAIKGGKAGLFELAHQGTIFLDEITETSPGLQARLLRVLQEKEVRRIGHDQVLPVNARVIAATNKNLMVLVKDGDFREDLYYRLNVLRLIIPPLRERKDDIPLLFKAFFERFRRQYKLRSLALPDGIIELLQSYMWPGNVRELVNAAERLAVGVTKTYLTLDVVTTFLPELLTSREMMPMTKDTEKNIIQQLEDEVILSALEKAKYNKTKAAEILGISRATLWRKLKQ